MNKDKLNKISVVISSALNNLISHLKIEEELAGIIGSKTPSDALSDLSKMSYENNQQKNKAVVIVVLGYLYFNADSYDDLKEAIIIILKNAIMVDFELFYLENQILLK